MRWRPRPRSAFALGLLCAITAALPLVRSAAVPSALPTIALATLGAPAAISGPTSLPSEPLAIDSTLTTDVLGCAGARSTVWNPLAGVEYTGRIRIDLPARYGGAIVLFIGDALPLDVEAETISGDTVRMLQRRLHPGPGLHVPPDFWLEDGNPWSAPGHIVHATVDAYHDRDLSFVVSLGRRAPRVLARLIGYPADVRVPVCAVPVDDGEVYFGTGWYGGPSTPREGAENGDVAIAHSAAAANFTDRWMRDVGVVLVASASGGATTVRVRATSAATTAADPSRLTLRVNDVLEMPAVAMREGVADYEWDVPDTAWVAGTNELLFSVSRTGVRGRRVFGMELSDLSLLRRE